MTTPTTILLLKMATSQSLVERQSEGKRLPTKHVDLYCCGDSEDPFIVAFTKGKLIVKVSHSQTLSGKSLV